MPELPEVETVRAGLAPLLQGARIDGVRLNRADLRFPFPPEFARELTGRTILSVHRRAKYLLFELSGGRVWLSHLGMTGSYRFEEFSFKGPSRYYEPTLARQHDHARFTLLHPDRGPLNLIYADPRRFGFMALYRDPSESPFLAGLGPEPLANDFNAEALAHKFAHRKAPLKAALLDQRVVAGLGNIYVCEALWRAHLRPTRRTGTLVTAAGKPTPRLEDLVVGVRAVLLEAIEAGGSTLRDFRKADGEPGYFQHDFAVYDRAGLACRTPGCTGTIERLVQSGRSSFFCPLCQH